MFSAEPGAVPSWFVSEQKAKEYAWLAHKRLIEFGAAGYGIRIHGAGDYPDRLRDADHPIELLYFQGWWELANSPRSIAVVGTRNPSDEGLSRTRKLVRSLLGRRFHNRFRLGSRYRRCGAHNRYCRRWPNLCSNWYTPDLVISARDPDLQRVIAERFLLISQVPVIRYERQRNPDANRHFFPSRNVTMSALTDATVIVEAGETSGTLVQARAAIKQGRKLFILDNCFQNPHLTWPHRFVAQGAIRVSEYDDIRKQLIPGFSLTLMSSLVETMCFCKLTTLHVSWRLHCEEGFCLQRYKPTYLQFQETNGSQRETWLAIQGQSNWRGGRCSQPCTCRR